MSGHDSTRRGSCADYDRGPGPIDLVRALFPLMGRGSLVVNLGSESGEFTTPWAGAYCASKAALNSLSEALGLELAPFGVRVVTIKAGGISSQFGKHAKQAADRVLAPGSAFLAFEKGIAARAAESQTRTASAESAAAFILKLAEKKKLPSVVRFGPKSLSGRRSLRSARKGHGVIRP